MVSIYGLVFLSQAHVVIGSKANIYQVITTIADFSTFKRAKLRLTAVSKLINN